MRLQGKTAIITGSGRGIGRAAALLFAKEGAKIAIVDIREAEGSGVVNEIKSSGGEAVFVKTDLTKYDEVKAMADNVVKQFGQIDILVTNAGWDEIKFFLQQTPQDWEFMINLNLKHHIYCASVILPYMVEKKYGKVVMCASDAGRAGNPGEAVYSACKGGVIGLAKTLAREMGRYNINVNCVAPGITETPLAAEMSAKMPAADKMKEAVARSTPMGRLGKPEDVAGAYLFFASDESSHITGQVLSVNGGLLMP